MKLINEEKIYNIWFPLIETKVGVTDKARKEWISKYCHYHSLNESSAYQTLDTVNGIGDSSSPIFPNNGIFSGTPNSGFYKSDNIGSGDKFYSLLPMSIQVAARTVGFDLVPVIPMSGPSAVLSYLDYSYAGGKISGVSDGTANNSPDIIKFPTSVGSFDGVEIGAEITVTSPNSPSGELKGNFIGNSRIDGFPILSIFSLSAGESVASVVIPTASISGSGVASGATVSGNPVLVKTLEDHIQGFSGSGFNNSSNLHGPYSDGTKTSNPMLRSTGESNYYRSLDLSTFTKSIEAGTFQISASVTFEQMHDLKRQYGINLLPIVKNALVNEVSQSINKHILHRGFALGWTNHKQFFETEGINLNLNLEIGSTSAGNTPLYLDKEDVGSSIPIPNGPSGGYENFLTIQRRLYSRILAAANVVANRGRRGAANFMVTNANVASILQDLSQFTFAPFNNTLSQNGATTLYPIGNVAGMTVYVDQNMSFNDTRILVGRKGEENEPGLKFMPYMMMESVQIISEGTMSPKLSVKSRYALVEAGHLPETMYITFYVNLSPDEGNSPPFSLAGSVGDPNSLFSSGVWNDNGYWNDSNSWQD